MFTVNLVDRMSLAYWISVVYVAVQIARILKILGGVFAVIWATGEGRAYGLGEIKIGWHSWISVEGRSVVWRMYEDNLLIVVSVDL